jgi:hypothetical protein
VKHTPPKQHAHLNSYTLGILLPTPTQNPPPPTLPPRSPTIHNPLLLPQSPTTRTHTRTRRRSSRSTALPLFRTPRSIPAGSRMRMERSPGRSFRGRRTRCLHFCLDLAVIAPQILSTVRGRKNRSRDGRPTGRRMLKGGDARCDESRGGGGSGVTLELTGGGFGHFALRVEEVGTPRGLMVVLHAVGGGTVDEDC